MNYLRSFLRWESNFKSLSPYCCKYWIIKNKLILDSKMYQWALTYVENDKFDNWMGLKICQEKRKLFLKNYLRNMGNLHALVFLCLNSYVACNISFSNPFSSWERSFNIINIFIDFFFHSKISTNSQPFFFSK